MNTPAASSASSRRALFAAEDLCGISRSLSRSTVQHHVLELIGLMRACPGLDFLDFFLHPQGTKK